MPVFTAAAAAVATAIGFTAGTTGFIIAQSLIAAGLAAGTGHLLGVFDDDGGLPPIEDPGVEQRLGANTQNRVPVLYGEFMQRGALTYAEITEDRKTLYAVITLGETSGGISISKIYWDDVLLTIAGTGEVTGGVDVEGNAVTRFNGNLNIVTYPNGGRSVYLETLVDDWTSDHKMTGLAYAVVTVRYNRDEDVTNLSDIRFIGNAPINNPAEAVIDQLTNTRYGLGLPTSVIDTDSFNAAKAYYETTLPYTDASGNTQMAERFQINGSLNSADPVFERIEAILLGSNSSLRWQGGKYSIFVNKADTVAAFTMTEGRVVGDIQVSEVGLNSVVNSVEVQYGRDANNNYQRNTVTVDLPTANRYPNELDRVRSIDLPLARTFVEAERIAYILLNQSREQLSIKHMATIEAMPLEAGDVITYTLPNYGWDEKQFRITRVSEMEVEDGLQYQIEAVEYAASVYTDRTHVEPGASPNTSIPQPGVLAAVTNLAISATEPEATVPNFTLTWSVPVGLYERFDIFVNNVLGTFDSAATTFLKSVYPNTSSYTSGSTVVDAVSGLPAGSYNIWVVGRNSLASSAESNTAGLLNWTPVVAQPVMTVIRHSDNVITNDPGTPPAPSGEGNSWYDPVGNAPDDPDPHWEATTQVPVPNPQNRIVDFGFSGITGEEGLVEEDVNQEIDFDFSGTIGERVQTVVGQSQVNTLGFTGVTASVVQTNTGEAAEWDLTLAQDNLGLLARTFDAGTVATDTFDKRYIRLEGTTPSNIGTTSLGSITITAGEGEVFRQGYEAGSTPSQRETSISLESDSISVTAFNNLFDTGPDDRIDAYYQYNYNDLEITIDGVFLGRFPAYAVQTYTRSSRDQVIIRIRGDADFASAAASSWIFSDDFLGNWPTTAGHAFPAGTVIKIEAFASTGSALQLRYSGSGNARSTDAGVIALAYGQDLTDATYVNALPDFISRVYQFRVSGSSTIFFSYGSDLTPAIESASGISGVPDGTTLITLTATTAEAYNVEHLFINPPDPEVDFGFISHGLAAGDYTASTWSIIISPVTGSPIPTINFALESSFAVGVEGIVNDFVTRASHPDLTFTISPDNPERVRVTVNEVGRGRITFDHTTGSGVGIRSDRAPGSFAGISPVEEGTLSTANIQYGSSSLTVQLASGIDATQVATDIETALEASANFTSLYTADTSAGDLILTSIADGPVVFGVTITQGTSGGTAPAATIAATNTENQAGTIDEFVGVDSIVTVIIGGDTTNVVVASDSLADAIDIVSNFITNDGRYTTEIVDDKLTATSTFVGVTPLINITIDTQGETSAGVDATLAVVRTIIEDGSTEELRGEFSTYDVSVGGTSIAAGTFAADITAAQAIQTILTDLTGATTDYTFTSVVETIVATSTFQGSTPDITMTIVPGLTITNTPATIAVVKSVAQQGRTADIDYSEAVWTYYVINQEIRVDDDTIDMMPDNSLQIRRGIIEDTQAWDDVSGNTDPNGVTASSSEVAYLTESFSSSSRTTTAVIQLNMLGTATIFEKATDPISMGFVLQQSTDAGVTWTNAISTFTFGVTTTDSALVYRTAAPISASNTLALTSSETYWFRMLRVFIEDGSVIAPPAAGNYGNFLVNMLLLEELTAS